MRQKAFNSIIILIAWSLWCHHNDRVFARRSVLSGALMNEIWAAVGAHKTPILCANMLSKYIK
jgi:hypothetical protein